MKNLAFLIARKYFWGTRNEKSISIMVKICFIGILIGTFALALIISVMNGFEKETHKKMQNINPEVIMQAYGNELDFEKIKKILETEFKNKVLYFSPNNTEQVIIKNNNYDEHKVVLLKAIDPINEINVTKINEKVVNSKSLNSILSKNKILLGKKIAKTLNLKKGDSVTILLPSNENPSGNKVSFNRKDLTIGGIFDTGIDEFDKHLVFCSLNLFNKIFNDPGITQIALKVNNKNEDKIITELKKRFDSIEIFSWKELYPALISALKLEKYVMFLILALITLVASMNIISLMFMLIIQKRPDIAILKAMGCSHNTIITIFLSMGLIISISAASCGLILSFIAGYLLKTYPFITLPDVYYVTHLPIEMDFSIFLAVFVLVIILSLLAIWIPIRKIKNIQISEVLRFET